MTLFRKLGPAKGAAAFAGAAWIVWAVCACVFFALPPAHVLAFGAFLLLAVISPGLALTKLLRLRLRPLESLCTGYGLGLALLLAVYFVFAPLRAMGGVRWAVAVLAVLSVWLNFRLRRQPLSGEADSGELRLALLAPSAFNLQHVRLVEVSDPALRAQIRQVGWNQVRAMDDL